jgi:hypothetical protein
MVAPPIGATNKSNTFTAMSRPDTRTSQSVNRSLRGGGSEDGFHSPATYFGVPNRSRPV